MPKDPNNAYGTPEARSEVLAKVSEDIRNRDVSDIERQRVMRSKAVNNGPQAMKEYMQVRTTVDMAADDARRRGATGVNSRYRVTGTGYGSFKNK